MAKKGRKTKKPSSATRPQGVLRSSDQNTLIQPPPDQQASETTDSIQDINAEIQKLKIDVAHFLQQTKEGTISAEELVNGSAQLNARIDDLESHQGFQRTKVDQLAKDTVELEALLKEKQMLVEEKAMLLAKTSELKKRVALKRGTFWTTDMIMEKFEEKRERLRAIKAAVG